MAHRIVVDLDSLAWNADAGEFEQQKVKAGAPYGEGAAHVDLGWLGEVAFTCSDPERIEVLAELLMSAARDLRIVQLGLVPFDEKATTEPSAA